MAENEDTELSSAGIRSGNGQACPRSVGEAIIKVAGSPVCEFCPRLTGGRLPEPSNAGRMWNYVPSDALRRVYATVLDLWLKS